MAKRKFSPIVIVAALVCVLLSACFLSKEESGFDKNQSFVRVLDVGQADCTLIYSNGYSALIDTGSVETSNEVCAALSKLGIKEIDLILLTHLHVDHTGGVDKIADLFEVKNAILPEISVESEGLYAAERLISEVTDNGGGVFNAQSGMNTEIGDFELTVLTSYGDMNEENNRSIISVAEIDGIKFMFTGDGEKKAENRLLKEGLNLKCDVFSAGHHGSSTSNSEELLKAVDPRYVTISAGEGNMYGHPHNEILALFERIGAKIFRTDFDGDITFYINEGKITPKTEK